MMLVGGGALSISDITSTGRHYVAASVNWQGMFGSDVSSGLFWMQNFSDMSGLITASASVTVLEMVDLSLRGSIRLGEEGDEFSPAGNALSLELGVSIGSGSF
jgi:hypothetical protein